MPLHMVPFSSWEVVLVISLDIATSTCVWFYSSKRLGFPDYNLPSWTRAYKALGIFGGTAAVGSVVDILLGAILGSTIGWRWMFCLTSIVGFIVLALGIFVIPADKSQSTVEDRRLDLFGMFCFTAGIVLVTYYLSGGSAAGWSSAKALAPFIIGTVFLILFVVTEKKIDCPVMPLRIWSSRRLLASCVMALFMMAAMNAHWRSKTCLVASAHILIQHPLRSWIHHCCRHSLDSDPPTRTKLVIVVALILNMIALASRWLSCQINSVADAANEDQDVVGTVYNVSIQIGAPIGIAVANIIANTKNSPDGVGA
ncbi:hypothetical protein BGX28_001045 [Mortierella sp. GBA30]|nr:hypothetical protein BGX28_001045 [Mortierella sp. GBA30]